MHAEAGSPPTLRYEKPALRQALSEGAKGSRGPALCLLSGSRK